MGELAAKKRPNPRYLWAGTLHIMVRLSLRNSDIAPGSPISQLCYQITHKVKHSLHAGMLVVCAQCWHCEMFTARMLDDPGHVGDSRA